MNSKGFTLLEVIAAIFILTVGLGASFSLIQQTFSATSIVGSRLIAVYLAQEGVEIIKNIRDSNWLEQRTAFISWDDGLADCQPPSMCCEVDYKTDTSPSYLPVSILGCGYGKLRYLNIDEDGFYSYSPGTPTKFKRKISVEIQEERMKVLVNVMWEEKGRTHNFEISEHITDWY